MNAAIGWGLAIAALALGWRGWGVAGVAFASSAIVFWLLLQFSRALRTLRLAAAAPVGHVDSAVMLLAKLRAGLPMQRVIGLARSLGRRIADDPDTWAWSDRGGAEVRIVFERGRCVRWDLTRPAG
jgi:hypothetical protein